MSPDDALEELKSQDKTLELLSSLLAEQAKLAIATEKANSLKKDEIDQEASRLSQQAETLRQNAQKIANDQQAQVWRERRLDEVLQRYILAEEKLITLDDAYSEITARYADMTRDLINLQSDIVRAIMALLTRDIAEMMSAKAALKRTDKTIVLYQKLDQYYDNLSKLELKAARQGAGNEDVATLNDIEVTKERIAEIIVQLEGLKQVSG